MKFPWVSRYRLEEADRRLMAADTERLRLLDLLLGEPDKHVAQARAAERHVEPVDDGIRPIPTTTEAPPMTFGNPFDRIEKRLEQSLKTGRVPDKFKARIN